MTTLAIEWAQKVLVEQGIQIKDRTPDIIQVNPWSSVYRFSTSKGFFFLKKVPEKLDLEPKIIAFLDSQFHARVPQIFAESKSLHCFLMQDAGIQLHVYLKQTQNFSVLKKILLDYAVLQIEASKQKQAFLDSGVPDWGCKKLPMLYQELIQQEELLIEDGLTKEDVIRLRHLTTKLNTLFEILGEFHIEDTFGHGDFHDKNILIHPDTQAATFIDLGEVVITHPFFSFNNCLHMAKENFALTEQQCDELRAAYCTPWFELESEKNILSALSIINQSWSIHAVLGEYRLMNSVDSSDFHRLHRQGRFRKKLEFWLNQ